MSNSKIKEIENVENIKFYKEFIESKIYDIRGQKAMLDFELAEIYNYSTKNFNRQVNNNISKFPNDFRFQLSKEEVDEISRCKNCTSIMQTSWLLEFLLINLFVDNCFNFALIVARKYIFNDIIIKNRC